MVIPAKPPLKTLPFAPSLRFGASSASIVKLPGQGTPGIGRKLLNYMDFKELNNSHVNQIQIVYLACIAWRLVAANERRKASDTKSWNEIRESALRDTVGFAFWFFATPLIQRGYLKWVGWKHPQLKAALIQKVALPDDPKAKKSFLQSLKAMNPLTSLKIPSSDQVNDWMEQAKLGLEQQGVKPSDLGYVQTEKFYKQLLMHRNIATAWGLGATIALLGVGINFLNIYMTRRNTRHREAALVRPSFPALPAVPKSLQPKTALNAFSASTTPTGGSHLTTGQPFPTQQPATLAYYNYNQPG